MIPTDKIINRLKQTDWVIALAGAMFVGIIFMSIVFPPDQTSDHLMDDPQQIWQMST